MSYEDYTVKAIEKVQIRQSDRDVGVIYPDSTTATNTYAVQGNLLLTTGTEANLKTVVQNLYNVLKNVTYTPVSYTHLTKFLLTLAALHLHTSQENLQTVTLIWKSVVHVICDMPFTTQPSTFVIGILSLLNTLPKNVLKVSTIMLPCLMPQRNSCG